MTTNRSENENITIHEIVQKAQPYVLLFVVVFGILLVVVPLLPGFISNFMYAFSGAKPKIYWYLSRSAGFVALTILWISMAMGLTITNRLARRWPGTPAAFAVHQYVSLLGLAFAVYHALVLMGDHFTDFSLPRLATPFSIDYERLWVGLGQTGFYIWVIVVLSFYVRKHIGQRAWRLIHFANFGIYIMGWLHGVFTGWDADQPWAQWYYWISGVTLLALVAYRVHDARSQKEAAKATVARRATQRPNPPQPAPLSDVVPVPAAPATAPLAPLAVSPVASSEPVSAAADSTKDVTRPHISTPPAEVARTPEVVSQPVVQEKEVPAPAPEPVKEEVIDKQPAVGAPRPSVPKVQRVTPVEQTASVLRIQKLFNELRPPQPLPEKPTEIEIPVLRIQLDLLAEQIQTQTETLWDKVALDRAQAKPASESKLLLRLRENLPQKQREGSPLKIRPRQIINEDRGDV